MGKSQQSLTSLAFMFLPDFESGGEATRPGTEKRCSHNLQSDPLGSGFKKGRENFPL